jgi:hypothetical protein
VGDAGEGEQLVQFELHVDEAHHETLTDGGEAQLAQLVDERDIERLTGIDGAERHLASLLHEEHPGARRDIAHTGRTVRPVKTHRRGGFGHDPASSATNGE